MKSYREPNKITGDLISKRKGCKTHFFEVSHLQRRYYKVYHDCTFAMMNHLLTQVLTTKELTLNSMSNSY